MNYRRLLLVLLTASLAACAPSDHLFVTNKIINSGMDHLPEDMLGRHLIGTVGFDEAHPSALNRASQGQLYVQGVKEDTPEYGYRVVRINVPYLKGLLWYADGEFTYPTAAAVPDHFPQLKAWDIVEFRLVDTYHALRDFSKTGEGNVVVKVLCHADDPNYKACVAAAPKIGKYTAGVGSTPYPASAKDYGFTFTPAYDSKGKPLRPLAEYKPR